MKLSKYNPLLSSGTILTILLIWTIAGCVAPNVWLSIADHMPVMASITNIVLPLGIYTLLASLTPKTGKATLWMTILFVFAAFQMVLLYMYGRSVIAVDMFLNVVTTNPGEVGELLGNMASIMLVVSVVYLPPIITAIVACRRHWRLDSQVLRRGRRIGILTTAAGTVCLGLSFLSERNYRPHCDLYPVNIAYNLATAVKRTSQVAAYHETSRDFTYEARSLRPDTLPETYVIVVGETSRADNWQIAGYDRPTSPRIMDMDGLVSFPRAISQSNTTHKSVPMLLSSLEASNFADSLNRVKSLITAFKEAGYHTTFVSNQSRNRSYIDFFGEEADRFLFLKDDAGFVNHYDHELLDHLDKALADTARKRLIVLHTYGSHFNYIDRFRPEEAFFKPDRPASATHHDRDRQINAYDNTILYTSNFLAGIIDRLRRTGTQAAMIYTSDHGEDIFDDDRHLFLHASPIPSYYQIHVPFIVWLSESYRDNNPGSFTALKSNADKYVASSRSYFHTVIDMAGISTPFFRSQSSLLNRNFVSGPALYLNDHNESLPLRECGILDYDFRKLDELGIPY